MYLPFIYLVIFCPIYLSKSLLVHLYICLSTSIFYLSIYIYLLFIYLSIQIFIYPSANTWSLAIIQPMYHVKSFYKGYFFYEGNYVLVIYFFIIIIIIIDSFCIHTSLFSFYIYDSNLTNLISFFSWDYTNSFNAVCGCWGHVSLIKLEILKSSFCK